MLRTLSIENIAVIKQTEIEFGDRFSVLTGETGAGKSILIDSLNSVLGSRTSKEIIRSGCDKAFVSALFTECSDELKKTLEELGYDSDEDELLISRTITADGHSGCRINGKTATVQILRQIAPFLVDIHGQHDNQLLMNPGGHYVYIDRMGNLEELRERYTATYTKLNQVKRKIAQLENDSADRERKLDLLEFQINELEAAEITVGEKDSLNERKNRIINSEKTAKLLNSVIQSLLGGEHQGAYSILGDAAHTLSKCLKYTPELEETFSRLEDISYELRDIAELVENTLHDMDYHPGEIDEIEERLDLLYRLSKKYGQSEEEMLSFLENAISERDELTNAEKNTEDLKNELVPLENETMLLARELSNKRRDTAKHFAEMVSSETAFLNMPNVNFSVDFSPIEMGANGIDKIEFLISVNLGEPLKPLSKVASGGELSRIMLAIKNVLAQYDDVDTLIFDEVDTGISGRAADKVGIKLKEIGKHRQVICVTHLAQIAAKADSHLLIEKNEHNNQTSTTVFPLDFEGRKNEIARIIGGENITETTLMSAEEMLKTQ